KEEIRTIANKLIANKAPLRHHILRTLSEILTLPDIKKGKGYRALKTYYEHCKKEGESLYNSHSFSSGVDSALNVTEVRPVYSDQSTRLNGYEILNKYFDKVLEKNPKVFAFGED